MIVVAVLALVVAVGVFTATAARKRGLPPRALSVTALRVGAGIALVRLAVLYGAMSLYGYADERQGLGYVLLILNSVVELALAVALSGGRPGSTLLIAALIGLTSFLLGFAWAWLRFKLRSAHGRGRE